ncbi:MAG: ABC transporter ATP-binding protein [Bariatricus sp.]
MWKYVKKYVLFAVLAALFMVGEVLMDLFQPEIMSKIVDEGVLGLSRNGIGDLNLIWHYGIIMIVLVLFGGLCGSLSNLFIQITSQMTGNDIRKDSFRKIMTFSFAQVDQFGTGSLVVRLTNDITQVQNLVSHVVRGGVRTCMLTFGSIFFMFRLNRTFGMIVLCASPLIVGWLSFCLYRANPLFTKLQEQLDHMNAIMQEDVSGIRMIKAYVREIYEKIRFGKANEELIGTQLQMLTIFAFMNPVMNFLMYVVVILILLTGSFEVQAGWTTPGTIMAGITYTTQLLNGILMLVMLFQNISRGLASWKRIKEVLDSRSILKDGDFEEKESAENKSRGMVEFRDVSFAYPGSGRNTLDQISLKIYPGETLAIMGVTGCGKSTLVNLIPRFYDVSAGEVLVDGIDVRKYRQKELREKIAFVQQKSELFSCSIEENIQWGEPGASEEAIREAAIAAQADTFIMDTSEGYQTMVAERGMSLSGGQKQRISIARGLLRNAEILIFDDSTSALDLKTEAKLYEKLKTYSPDTTKIIIAQRIASVRQADRIVILENGKIAACGTHEELLQNCRTYQDIYDSQMGKEGGCDD